MNINNKQIYLFIIVTLLILLTSYFFIQGSSIQKVEDIQKAEETDTLTRTISIGTIGDDAVTDIKLFQPTADYIAARLSYNGTIYFGKVIIVKNMDNMSNMLKRQELDLYVGTPFPTIMIARKSGIVPFLGQWKNGVAHYHTLFFVRDDSYINSTNDFEGKTIASEDEASTASYLMPKAYLIQKGFKINQTMENSIKFVFSGGEKNTPVWIIEGKADIGAMNNIAFEKIPENIKSKLRVIERSIDMPQNIVSYRRDMEPASVEKIQKILLDMDKDPQGIEILKNFENTKKYERISMEEMNNLGRMVDLLE